MAAGHPLRTLRHRKAFSAMVIALVALSVAANTIIFSLVNAVWLAPLPFPDARRLIQISEVDASTGCGQCALGLAESTVRALRGAGVDIDALAYYRRAEALLGNQDDLEAWTGIEGSASLSQLLGMRTSLGRAVGVDDEVQQEHVLVVSDRMWRRRFAADSQALGRVVSLNGEPFTLIGVLSPAMRFPEAGRVDFWIRPHTLGEAVMSAPRTSSVPKDSGLAGGVRDSVSRKSPRAEPPVWRVMATRRLDARIERVQQELLLLSTELSWARSKDASGRALRASPLREAIGGASRGELLWLLGTSLLMLLVMCVNLVGLALSRLADQRRDVALKMVLGARRIHVIVENLYSNGILVVVGVGIAWLLCSVMLHAFASDLATVVPNWVTVQLDIRVFAFVAAICLVAVLSIAVLPAVLAGRTEPQDVLRTGSTTTGLSPRHWRLLDTVVGAQVGIATVLVGIGIALSWNYLGAVTHEMGYDPSMIVEAEIAFPRADSGVQRRRAVVEEAIGRVQRLPGVAAVGSASLRIITFPGIRQTRVFVEGRSTPVTEADAPRFGFVVSPGYFRAMDARLISGREFTHDAQGSGEDEVVLNEAAAQRLWRGANTIGRQMRFEGATFNDRWYTVIGIVSNLRRPEVVAGTEKPQQPLVYFDVRRDSVPDAVLVARASSDPSQVIRRLRAATRSGETRWVRGGSTIEQTVAWMLEPVRLRAYTVVGFAGVALLISLCGLYALLALIVRRRTRDIGIRLAIGASPFRAFRWIVGRGALPAAVGLAAGAAAIWVVDERWGELLLPGGLWRQEPVALAAVVMIGSVLAALSVPASIGARTPPASALRTE